MNDGQSNLFAMLGPDFLANPYVFYDMVRSAGGVMHAPGVFGIGAYLVTSHSLCSSLLKHKELIKEGDKVLPPERLKMIPQEASNLAEQRKNSMLFRDPPAHTRLRSLVNQAFTPRTIERLRQHVGAIAKDLVSGFEKGRAIDLIKDFAFPLPIIVIAELLGVPPEDRDRFKAWSTDLTLGLSPLVTQEELVKVDAALRAIDGYLTGIIEERRREARPDLISDLVRAQEAGDKLTMPELVATCRLILTAGHETTVNLIGNGVLALLRNKDQLDVIARDRSLLANAVEEVLRFDSPVQMTMRFAAGDCPLGTETAKRGDLVILLIGGANRDPSLFPEPNRLDVRRENAHAHLAFGAGPHYCLGAALARLEGAMALGALLDAAPNLSLAEEKLTWRPNIVLRGLRELPVKL